MLRPTRLNFEAWDATLKVCRILKAGICVIQSPPQFGVTRQNLHNLTRFFREIDRDGLMIEWEPRGDWNVDSRRIRKICEKLDLLHIVDPLRRRPAKVGNLQYFRLHGLGPRELSYSYRYTPQDLTRLAKELKSLSRQRMEEAYVMFNNITMFDDARRFERIAV